MLSAIAQASRFRAHTRHFVLCLPPRPLLRRPTENLNKRAAASARPRPTVAVVLLARTLALSSHIPSIVNTWHPACLPTCVRGASNARGREAIMFEQTLIPVGKTKRPLAVVIAFGLQLLGVGILLLIPMLFVDSLPIQSYVHVLLAAPPPPPPPPPPPMPAPVVKVARAPRQFNANVLMAPRTIPKEVAMIKDEELPPPSAVSGVVGGVPGGIPGGSLGGVIGGIVGAVAAPAPPPPPAPPAPKKAETPQQVRVSGEIQAGLLVRQVQPEYPPLARRARIEGTVVLKAIIARDGSVKQLNLVSGQPLLIESAMNAVRQWLYKPTYLNGEAVEVITEIDVNFHMQAR